MQCSFSWSNITRFSLYSVLLLLFFLVIKSRRFRRNRSLGRAELAALRRPHAHRARRGVCAKSAAQKALDMRWTTDYCQLHTITAFLNQMDWEAFRPLAQDPKPADCLYRMRLYSKFLDALVPYMIAPPVGVTLNATRPVPLDESGDCSNPRWGRLFTGAYRPKRLQVLHFVPIGYNIRLLEALLYELYDAVDYFVLYETDATQIGVRKVCVDIAKGFEVRFFSGGGPKVLKCWALTEVQEERHAFLRALPSTPLPSYRSEHLPDPPIRPPSHGRVDPPMCKTSWVDCGHGSIKPGVIFREGSYREGSMRKALVI